MSNISDKPWLVPGHMYQYDIGWLVDKLLSFETELNTAIDLKTIHYADPIQWDITTQYAPNTVVVDPKTGTAYMSKVPVPSGVLLTNTDYWVVIFNYQRIYDKIMSGIAFNDKDNLNATKDLIINDLVWYGGDLYRCIRDIQKGTTYIPGTNLTPTTIAECLETYYGNDRAANVLNDTVNVSRDYTLNAGNIAETSENRTVTSENSTETISGDKTVNGTNETKILSGKRTVSSNGYEETVAGNKTVSAGSLEENVAENKETTSKNLNETVTLKKTVNAGSLEENAEEKTENISGNYLENVVGTKEIKSNQLFVNTKDPLKYGEVVDKKVKFVDKNGAAYYLLTDETKFEGNTLYNDFYVDDIVEHSPDYFNDNDTLKDYTSGQFYNLYDSIPNSDLVKTQIGVDNEGSAIYAYKHTANNKRGLNITNYVSGKLNAKAALFVSGQHGPEKQAIITLYRWVYDEFQKEFSYILENYDIMIVPCGSPHNIDTNQYYNSNGVNPNRNFPIGFKPSATSGETPLDQKQSKALYDYTLEAINTYGLSLLVFNCHNSNYFEHAAGGESRVLWYNVNANAVDNKYNNNLLKATAKIRKDILDVYPYLYGNKFNSFLGTVSDGTYGGFVSGSGCRFVLAESPIRWTENGNWFDQKTGYINYLILYNTFKACLSDEFYTPYKVNFNSLSQIGCSNNNTLTEVCDKLPPTCSISVLLSSTGSTLSNDLPTRNVYTGLLKITKEHETNRCVITFTVADGSRNSIEWGASYKESYGLSNWTPRFAELSNVNFDAKNITWNDLVNRIGNSAVLRVVSGYSLYSILPVQYSGMLFIYSPLLPSDFSTHTKICFFVSDNGGFYINNNNVPNASNWITIKSPTT